MDPLKLKTYQLGKELLAHLGDQPAPEGSAIYRTFTALKELVDEIAIEEGHNVLAKELAGVGLVFNGEPYRLSDAELKFLQVRKDSGYYPKIETIKMVRERTGLGLMESKTLVEHYMKMLNLRD